MCDQKKSEKVVIAWDAPKAGNGTVPKKHLTRLMDGATTRKDDDIRKTPK